MTNLGAALRDLDEEKVYKLVDEKIQQGIPPLEIINECNEGIVEVGELFASGKYFLTDLMFSAEIMQAVMQKLEPLIEANSEQKNDDLIVIGTVEGDIHDIGKNIVISLMRSHGFKVIDLGVDVPAEKFIETVRENKPKVLGLSALLNSTYPQMKKVIDELTEAGLRDKVKVIIGGTICSETVRQFTGADAYATDAMTGINFCKSVFNK